MKNKHDSLGMADGAKMLNRELLSSVSDIITAPSKKPTQFTRSALSYHLQQRRQHRWASAETNQADEFY